jgi:hypothetical protein
MEDGLDADLDQDLGRADPGQAAAALARADQARAAVHHHGRWVAGFLLAYGVATLAFLPLTGIVSGWSSLVAMTAWPAFVLASAGYARRWLVVRRGVRRLYLGVTAAWTLLWLMAVGVGFGGFAGRPAYWIAAGAVVSLPMFGGAARVVRR